MTYFFTGDDDPEYNNQGTHMFALTFEGVDQHRTGRTGFISGTLTPNKGDTPFKVLCQTRTHLKKITGIELTRVIFWDLRPNKL